MRCNSSSKRLMSGSTPRKKRRIPTCRSARHAFAPRSAVRANRRWAGSTRLARFSACRASSDGLLSLLMSDVTQILNAIDQGDAQAAEQVLPLVYDELRKLAAQKMAQEAPGHTLTATALVHEAYLRLVNTKELRRWDSRGHFF